MRGRETGVFGLGSLFEASSNEPSPSLIWASFVFRSDLFNSYFFAREIIGLTTKASSLVGLVRRSCG